MAKEKAPSAPGSDEETVRLREWARKSLKKKQDFKQLVGVWFAVSVLLSAIWAMTGQGVFLAYLGNVWNRYRRFVQWSRCLRTRVQEGNH
jgi:hypothetical protein